MELRFCLDKNRFGLVILELTNVVSLLCRAFKLHKIS